MSETTEPGVEREIFLPEKTLGENAFLKFVQRPRIMLILLAVWAVIGVLTEAFTNSGLFLDNHNAEIDGAIAGRALSWQGIPLAVLYVYCARDPVRFQRIFWLALIEQAAAVASVLYHWVGTKDYTGESIIIPLAGSGALATLVFIHLFQPREGDKEKPAHAPA